MQDINYSPMQGFNAVFNSNMNNINSSANMLEGGVQVSIPKEQIANDIQLQDDLGKLTINEPDGAGGVAKKFSEALSSSMEDLNGLQRNAERAVETFATGGDIDVHSVMIASQKASLSLSLAMQLRNKAVQAYSEIYRMTV